MINKREKKKITDLFHKMPNCYLELQSRVISVNSNSPLSDRKVSFFLSSSVNKNAI